jgi:hypothetical protein
MKKIVIIVLSDGRRIQTQARPQLSTLTREGGAIHNKQTHTVPFWSHARGDVATGGVAYTAERVMKLGKL